MGDIKHLPKHDFDGYSFQCRRCMQTEDSMQQSRNPPACISDGEYSTMLRIQRLFSDQWKSGVIVLGGY